MASLLEERQKVISETNELNNNDNNDLFTEQQMNGLTLHDGEDEENGGGENGNENMAKSEEPNGKGNEEKKIFCGGISYETSNEDLAAYFANFGKVKEVQVKYDRLTGRSRGFAFVEFESIEACKASLVQREQTIKGKQCEIKPAKSRETGYMNKKIFVGGLPGDFPEEELRSHFSQYGKVEEIEWPFDKQSKIRKNFAFVVFEDEESADRAAAISKQNFASRECDVKKAVPQNRTSRAAAFTRGANIIMRNSFAGGNNGGVGLRGAHQMPPLYPTTAYTQWYYNAAAAAAAYGGGGGNWYGGNATTATAAANPTGAWFNNGGAVGGGQHNNHHHHHHHQSPHQHTSWYSSWYGNGMNGSGGELHQNGTA